MAEIVKMTGLVRSFTPKKSEDGLKDYSEFQLEYSDRLGKIHLVRVSGNGVKVGDKYDGEVRVVAVKTKAGDAQLMFFKV
jgi:hypothetical protein